MLVNKTPIYKTSENIFKNKFTLESLLLIYSETFPLDSEIGAEKISLENNSDKLSDKYPYHSQPLVMLTSFLNLPNQKRKSDKLSILDVLKNMIDWDLEDEKNSKFSTLDNVLAAPMFVYHVLRMLVKLPFSIAKIVTEFLPGIGEESCRIAMKKSKENSLGFHAARIGYGIFSTLHFIGRAITSPIKGWMSTYGENKALGILSLVTSSLAWGLIGAVTFAAPVVAVLAAPVLIAKLINDSLFFGSIAFCSIIFKSVFNIYTGNGILKPLLKNIIHAITPSKKDSNDSTETKKFSDSPTTQMRFKIGISKQEEKKVSNKGSNIQAPTGPQVSLTEPSYNSDNQSLDNMQQATPFPSPTLR